MRVEPYTVGSLVHVMKRGARGLNITRDEEDRVRFMRLLWYVNDESTAEFWERETYDIGLFFRPSSWPQRSPLVKILAWVLMPNHFHLLLEEIRKGGISKFMQKLCISMTARFNVKYKERGSIFQGPFKARTISTDPHLERIAPYIMVKNVFELYPAGGLQAAMRDFDDAWKWGTEEYAFSSLPDYAQTRSYPIIEKDFFDSIFDSPAEFRAYAKEQMLDRDAAQLVEI